MPVGIATRNFRIFNASKFVLSVTGIANNNLYIFIGKPSSWPNESSPPNAVDNIRETSFETWRNMIALKKVSPSDITLAIPRKNWTSGKVYAEYDHANSSYADSDFYSVVRSGETYNVYKCLFNNNGAPSTIQPSGTSTSKLLTNDGYIWKFMYSVSAAEALKFVNTFWIPVKKLRSDDGSVQWDVQQAATNNSIDIIDVVTSGNNYVVRANTFASVTNSTFMTLDSSASSLDSSYQNGSLFISGGLGAGQVANVLTYNGTTKTVTLSGGISILPNTSSSFHVGPRIIINGDGVNAKAYANVANRQVTKINMINVGTRYTKANVTILGANGAGATAIARISPPGGHGSNPIYEMFGHNALLNVRIQGTEGNNFPTNNDFRMIGLLADPLLANGSFANGLYYDQTTNLTISGINNGPFQKDEFISGLANNAVGRVVSFANTNGSGTAGILKVVDISRTFETEIITGNTSGATASISAINIGELRPFTGDILYKENNVVTNLTYDGITDVKLVIRY